MTAPILIDHRRNRQQSQRFMREIIVRGRDLTGSFFQSEFDLLYGQSRMRVFPQHSTFARNAR